MLETDLLLPWQDVKTLSDKQASPIYGVHAASYESIKSGNKTDTPVQTDPPIPEMLHNLSLSNNFTGEVGEILCTNEGALIGLGDGSDPFAWAIGANSLPQGLYYITNILNDNLAHLAALSWLLGTYKFDRYKLQKKPVSKLIAPSNVNIDSVKHEATAIGLTRNLVNTPTNDMLPHHLEEEASTLCKEQNAHMKTIEGDDLITQNFPLVHAVGRASTDAPRLIDIKWQPDDAPSPNRRKVTIVGKGVCFDNGGLNMKSGAGMALMKKDMGGAANSLGLAQMIMANNLDIDLRVILPVVENAIAGNAFRPSDVIPSRKGLTVEIGNTDAEGRLILADALTYATEDDNKPDLLISLATLTGAARVALGPELVPFYCDDPAISAKLAVASEETFDPVWQMPLWSRYAANLSSNIASVNNISGNSFAGSIIAALFLKKFIPAGTPWIHFDIYAWRPQSEPGRPKGGEAQAIRALFSMIKQHYTIA